MTRGGKRPNSGRKKIPGLKMRSMRLTDAEHAQVRELIRKMREAKQDDKEIRD
jgi:hypothetical protein